jgi:hypothetical protein
MLTKAYSWPLSSIKYFAPQWLAKNDPNGSIGGFQIGALREVCRTARPDIRTVVSAVFGSFGPGRGVVVWRSGIGILQSEHFDVVKPENVVVGV